MIVACTFSCYDYVHDQDPTEDWDDYTDVFVGDGPDQVSEDVIFKLNINGYITGEIEGVFYSKVEGTLTGTNIKLQGTERSYECSRLTHVYFDGDLVGSQLAGTVFYDGCEIYEFYYEGRREGGTGRVSGTPFHSDLSSRSPLVG